MAEEKKVKKPETIEELKVRMQKRAEKRLKR